MHETIHAPRAAFRSSVPQRAEGPEPRPCDPVTLHLEPATSDRELVARIAQGDERAMQVLVEAHGGTVFALTRAILRERADAEEAAADTFLQAWRTAATFDPARSSVVAWLGVIARSRALDRLRARNRQGRLLIQETEAMQAEAADVPQPEEGGPDRAFERREARQLVTNAMRELPEAQRKVIELAYFGGLSQSEIAARLEMPLGTVKTRTLLAFRFLRSRLGPLLREEVA